jgi:Ca2+-binding RTX toxin-like protein
MATRRGKNGPDTLAGTAQGDGLFGYGGNDALRGLGGRDVLKGGAGDDGLWGGDGNDTLWGERGSDDLWGGRGDDRLGGGQGPNRLFGEDGDDVLIWNPGRILVNDHWRDAMSVLDGGAGADTLWIVNETTASTYVFDEATGDFVPATVASGTLVYLDDEIPAFNGQHRTVMMGEPSWETEGVAAVDASLAGIERIEVSGDGPLTYFNATAEALTVLGTAHADVFTGGAGNETLEGRGGGDTYAPGLGDDLILSAATGADGFLFDLAGTGRDAITGWSAGDRITFFGLDPAAPGSAPTPAEAGGVTTFAWTDAAGAGHGVSVDATGLLAGRDYLFA